APPRKYSRTPRRTHAGNKSTGPQVFCSVNHDGALQMSNDSSSMSRRRALQCLAYGSAGTLFAISGGVLAPVDLPAAATTPNSAPAGKPLFVQISDTHIGFHKDANPDVNGTLSKSIALVNAMPQQPKFLLHTGDITHLSKAEEFDAANELFKSFHVDEMHV